MPNRENQATDLVREAERHVDALDSGPFSSQAFQALKMKVSGYVRALVVESARISRRRGEDVISASHVEQASDYLVTSSSRRWLRHLGTVGGILLGAALSNFLAMTSSSQYSTTGVVVSAALAIIGAFGVALHIGRE